MWVEGLHASDLDQPPFADKEPEAQSFWLFIHFIHFFILGQTSILDVSGHSIEDNQAVISCVFLSACSSASCWMLLVSVYSSGKKGIVISLGLLSP